MGSQAVCNRMALHLLVMGLVASSVLATPILDRPNAESRRALDSIGGGHLLRSLDSIGGANLLRGLDSIGGAHLLRQVDSIGGGNLLRSVDHVPRYHKRGYDPLRGMIFGVEKKNFDEIDSGRFNNFFKKNFDEIDSGRFNNFVKKNFDQIDSGRLGFNSFNKRVHL